MATTRIMPLHTGKGRSFGTAITRIIDYVSNPDKTDNGQLITSFACDSRCADAEFLLAKREYIRKTGRERGKDDVIAYHVRQSFVPGETTAEDANRIGVAFAKRFTKENHAFIVCTHIDKAHIHNHIIWSAVNTDCDRKFRNFWGSTQAVRHLSDTLCIENGLSIVENPAPHGLSYDKWLGNRAKPSHREQLRMAIDAAIQRDPIDLDALLKDLEETGCSVTKRGKNINLQMPGWKKAARLDSLGDGYTKEDLIAVLSGKRSDFPRRKPVLNALQDQAFNTTIDIASLLQAGKSIGYQRWAKKFNLKQFAQTYNFLTERNLLDRTKLAQEVNTTTTRFHELSAQIKSAEAGMTEISQLRKHIINYAKSRDVYMAYRKSGYSKQFLQEHESEILLHKAAKAAFDERDLKKLPSIQTLQLEYAQLLRAKKEAYSEYRKVRDEMKKLLIAQENLDRLMSEADMTQQQWEKEKEMR